MRSCDVRTLVDEERADDWRKIIERALDERVVVGLERLPLAALALFEHKTVVGPADDLLCLHPSTMESSSHRAAVDGHHAHPFDRGLERAHMVGPLRRVALEEALQRAVADVGSGDSEALLRVRARIDTGVEVAEDSRGALGELHRVDFEQPTCRRRFGAWTQALRWRACCDTRCTMRLSALAPLTAVAAFSIARGANAEVPTIIPPGERGGFELTMSAAYAHTSVGYAGRTSRGSTGGVAAGAGLGLRSSHWALAVQGEYAEMPSPPDGDLHTVFTGFSTSYFFLPERRLNPWTGVGVGYRFAGGDGVSSGAVELGRLLLGADLDVPGLLSMGPMIGFALDLFPMAARSEGGRGPTLHGFAFAGLQARFDLTPTGLPD